MTKNRDDTYQRWHITKMAPNVDGTQQRWHSSNDGLGNVTVFVDSLCFEGNEAKGKLAPIFSAALDGVLRATGYWRGSLILIIQSPILFGKYRAIFSFDVETSNRAGFEMLAVCCCCVIGPPFVFDVKLPLH